MFVAVALIFIKYNICAVPSEIYRTRYRHALEISEVQFQTSAIKHRGMRKRVVIFLMVEGLAFNL